MKRASYSVHHALSVHLGTLVQVPNLAMRMLVCRADTDSRVAAYKVAWPEIPYRVRDEERLAPIALTVTLRDSSIEHWDISSRRTQPEGPAARAKRAYCEHTGTRFREFERKALEARSIESSNRLSAQCLLYTARRLATDELQTEVLLKLDTGPLTVGELVTSCQRSETLLHVVVLRLWLLERVQLPIDRELMCAEWLVRRVDHGK